MRRCIRCPKPVAEISRRSAITTRWSIALRARSAPDLPLLARDGGFIATGYDARLDELKGLRDDSRRTIARLQATYAESTGISALKIRHNNVLGYYIEMAAKHGERLIDEDRASKPTAATPSVCALSIARPWQTRCGLRPWNLPISTTASAPPRTRRWRWNWHCSPISSRKSRRAPARSPTRPPAMAALDVAGALAQLAVDRDYVRPVVDAGTAFAITGGRHPVVEAALRADGGQQPLSPTIARSATATAAPGGCG